MSTDSLAPTIVFDGASAVYQVSCVIDGKVLSANSVTFDGALSWFVAQRNAYYPGSTAQIVILTDPDDSWPEGSLALDFSDPDDSASIILGFP
jgi:hypothetical protein